MPTEPKLISESPNTSDVIKFELLTTDEDGNATNPYKFDKVVIYFLSRDFTSAKHQELTDTVNDTVTITSYFNKAQVVKVFGDDDNPAWLSTDIDNALMEKVGTGEFELLWTPQFAREGDYIVCWTWTPIIAGDRLSSFEMFHLASDTSATTVIPTHRTNPDKYPTLLERYLPEHVKLRISDSDLTPATLAKLNGAIGDGFVILEDFANQMIDVLDANAINEANILFLANLFNLNLRSNDTTLWRRQIKSAVPLFKQKGTLKGLKQALSQAGITFISMQQLWQVTSPYTYQEAFTVTGDQDEFELAKPVYDMTNFDLFLRAAGETEYVTLDAADYGQIIYDSADQVYVLRWKGNTAPVRISLADGDILRIVYKLTAIADSSIENHIRNELSLADTRDEAEVTYPPKNWNVYLMEESDAMFSTIIPVRHPFHKPVVFGKVRTKFPYSENIYNMEEYNGSLRDSTDPCNISKDFLDSCSNCISSKFNIDVQIDEISSNRIDEATIIIDEYKPFHAIIHQLTFSAGVSEFIVPQQESVEFLVSYNTQDVMVNGNDAFTRVIEDGLIDPTQVKRDMLADVVATTSASGSATNDAITIYSPGVSFEQTILGLDVTSNVLEILSGPDAGEYELTDPDGSTAAITQGAPDTITYPLSEDAFPFRLSNKLFDNSVTSIANEDIFTFSDPTVDFRLLGVQPGWQIVVSDPPALVGTYTVVDSFPNNTLQLDSWANTSDASGITYQLQDDLSVDVGDESDEGEIDVTRRGIVDGGTDFRIEFQVKQGDYLVISGTQYRILEFINDDEFYIEGWTGGTVGSTSAQVLRRLLDEVVGYLDVRGMKIDTSPTNYESTLSISNGANNLGPYLENNQFKENFLILMDGVYYSIAEIDGEIITIYGPRQSFGLAGAAVNFDIVQFEKLPKTIQGHDFSFIDRRNGDIATYASESVTSMMLWASMLNNVNSNQSMDFQSMSDSVSIEVEWEN